MPNLKIVKLLYMANTNVSEISDSRLLRAWKIANNMLKEIKPDPMTGKLSPQGFKRSAIIFDEIEKMIHEFNRRGLKIPGQKRSKAKRKRSKKRSGSKRR